MPDITSHGMPDLLVLTQMRQLTMLVLSLAALEMCAKVSELYPRLDQVIL